MTGTAIKIAALLKSVRPNRAIATVGEKNLWINILHGSAKVLIENDKPKDLLAFVRKAGGTRW